MRQGSGAARGEKRAAEVPFAVRVLGRLVLEVLPATLASVIGAFLLVYCLFGHAALPAAAEPPAQAAPASAAMVQLIGEEHALVRNFLLGRQQEAKRRAETTDAADARAIADAKLGSDAAHRMAASAAAEPSAPRAERDVAAAAAPSGRSTATAQLPPVVIAAVRANADAPSAEPRPANTSLIGRTLAAPRRVVAVTLHAVMALGGIPSWIGHRVGADRLDNGVPTASAAS